MPDENSASDPPLEIPDARPYIIGVMAAGGLAYAARYLIQQKSSKPAWGLAAAAADILPPRRWTTAFSDSDKFLAQLKDIAPNNNVPKL